MHKPRAYLIVELDVNPGAELHVVRAGIYSCSHHELTRNLKLVAADVIWFEGDTYEEARKKVLDYVGQVKHFSAWSNLLEMLEECEYVTADNT